MQAPCRIPEQQLGIYAPGSSNGLNGTVNGFEKHTSPAEMTVADLSPNLSNTSSSSSIDSACPPEPLRKVAVPPRRPVPADEGKAYQQASTINGRGRKITAQAQRVIDQFVSLTGGGGALTAPNGISSTELAAVESKLKRQSIELREAKAELAERTAEVAALRAQAIERESRLRGAKSEIMEARAGAAEKEAKLIELYQILADSGAERARLRDELAQTKMELVETQGELENLADEILAMKELVLNDSELAELNAGMAAASKISEEELENNNSSSFESSIESMTASAAAAAEGTWDVLQQLAEMSRQMLDDAKLDEEAFNGAGFFNKLASGRGRISNGATKSQEK
ncbi:hypothetical protein NADE_005354 [Nannochloris sp. 'desiccata']|nr:hypothetical protein KSW81_007286 [Chlorella desiccata (nom. nud.)]KAH7618504.1 hypothetical protein NADE_005354 [Chlorella desiccata (nom. nud.)]